MPKSEKFQKLPAPWDRIFSLSTRLIVWSLLITVIYILRPFFLLIFLTFVFAYVQTHSVEGLQHRFRKRAYRVVLVFVVFLGVIGGTGYFIAPHVQEQTQTFVSNWDEYMEEADVTIRNVLADYPSVLSLLETPPISEAGQGPPADVDGQDTAAAQESQQLPKAILEPQLANLFLGFSGDDPSTSINPEKVLGQLQTAFSAVLGITSAFLLSILFSFLIVLDLPKLTLSVRALANTRLDFIYEEVAENIHDFGKVLGRALEAQLLIAICNTLLTAVGIFFIGLESIIFLATIVFFCSFIPVVGVFISSTPICLLALQSGSESVSGIQMMLIAIALILLIHFIEAYFLNPRIFGHHLRMNAVIVLIVLTIGGKLFGVWGLILGLPVVNYFFVTAIRRKPAPETGREKAA